MTTTTKIDYEREYGGYDVFVDIGTFPSRELRQRTPFKAVELKLLKLGADKRAINRMLNMAVTYHQAQNVGAHLFKLPTSLYGDICIHAIVSGAVVSFRFSIRSHQPPAAAKVEMLAAERCLRVMIPLRRQEELIGDLMERYEVDGIADWPKWSARLWVVRHSASMVWAGCELRRLSLVASVLRLLHKLVP